MPVLQTDLRETAPYGFPRSGHTLRGHRFPSRTRFAELQQTRGHSQLLFPSQLDRIGYDGTVRYTGKVLLNLR